jgi:hypothetical protein
VFQEINNEIGMIAEFIVWTIGDMKMEESEIKFSLEDIRKVLEKFEGTILYHVTIDNIMDDFKDDFIKENK